MVETNSKFLHQAVPTYVNPDQVSDITNIRLRHYKSNSPIETKAQPEDFIILSTSDFQSNERDNDPPLISLNKHNRTQICLLIFMALSYVIHSLRGHIPENTETNSHFWSIFKLSPITRVYTSDLRPSLNIENFLLRFAEECQTLWILYTLSYIPRRINFGYIYRNPNIFNSFLCILLTSAVSLQTLSQTALPPEISCACLFISFILLIASCRLVALKLVKYEEKIKPAELIITRYFVLNSLFLYTTSISYLTICASIECIAFHLDPDAAVVTLATRIGLSIIFILLLIYFLLDRFVYENEFRSIWTPYIFIAIVFICPLLSIETSLITDYVNYYLHWAFFSTTILIILYRISGYIVIKYRQMKAKSRINKYIEPVTLESRG